MNSGFDHDPEMVIVSMQDLEDKEKDGVSPTEVPETDAAVAGDTAGHRGDREFDRDSAN